MTDQNLSDVEGKELTGENSQDNQNENPYLPIAKDIHKEQKRLRRQQTLAIMRQQDEELKNKQNNTPQLSDEEIAAREKKLHKDCSLEQKILVTKDGEISLYLVMRSCYLRKMPLQGVIK